MKKPNDIDGITLSLSQLVHGLGLVHGSKPESAIREIIRQSYGADSEARDTPPAAYSAAMREAAIESYAFDTGMEIRPVQGGTEVEDSVRLLHSGLYRDSAGAAVFIHTPYAMRDGDMTKFKKLAQRPDWYAKIQLAMRMLSFTSAHYYQFWNGGQSLEQVQYDPDYCSWMMVRVREFFLKLESEPVDPHLKPLLASVDTPEAAMLLAEYDELGLAVDNATERKKEIVEELIQLTGGEAAVICGRKLSKICRAGAIDYKALIADKLPGEDIEVYRKAGSEFWSLK